MDMSEIYHEKFWKFFEELDVSLEPKGPEQLFEIASPYLKPGSRILDVGCRDARYLIKLIELTGGSGTGVDPVAWHIERARAAVADAGIADAAELIEGVAERLPVDDAAYDIVWCRDVVEVLPDLSVALSELARALKIDGHVIVYTNVLDGDIDPTETQRLHSPLGNVPANLVDHRLESEFGANGLRVVEKHVIGTEWREHLEETEQIVSRDLLRLARLRRRRERFVAAYGIAAYETAEASLQWSVQQFLGRLVPTIYVLSKRA